MRIRRARRAFRHFHRLWFDAPGIRRQEAELAAWKALAAIRDLSAVEAESIFDEWDGWFAALYHVPSIARSEGVAVSMAQGVLGEPPA